MRMKQCCLIALLTGCSGRALPPEPESDWTPADDTDVGPVYVLVTEDRNDDPIVAGTTTGRALVFDVSQSGGQGEHAVVLETAQDTKYPTLSRSRRWAAIAVGEINTAFPALDDIHLIDFAHSALEPARPIQRPDGGGYYFRDYWFAPDDSGLAVAFDGDGSDLYYVPLVEAGPLVPIEVPTPMGITTWCCGNGWTWWTGGFTEDSRRLVFFADEDEDGRPTGLYVSEIVDGSPSPAVPVHEVSSPMWLGEDFHAGVDAVIFETYETVDPDGNEPPLHRLHRINLETLELVTLTEPEPEPERWYATPDGSRVLFTRGPHGDQHVDLIEIIDGEPKPAQPLVPGDDDAAQATYADFISSDGRYGFAGITVVNDVDYEYFIAWYDFESSTPTEPLGIEPTTSQSGHDGDWLASPTPDGRVLVINPSLELMDLVELPEPWHALFINVYAEKTRIEVRASEGPPGEDLSESFDGLWTLRATDELGPPVRFDPTLGSGQHLGSYFNLGYVPTSERHFYEVEEAGETISIWEDDGVGAPTMLGEIEGYDSYLIVVAPEI